MIGRLVHSRGLSRKSACRNQVSSLGAICVAGVVHCRVTAHTTVGHATMNPRVVFVDGMGSAQGGVGGYAPVAPGSASWVAWKQALRSQKSTLRFRMPYMTPEAIHAELSPIA